MDRAPDFAASLQQTFSVLRAAFDAAPYPDWTLRRDRLRRLQALLRTHAAEFAETIDADFGGRPPPETGMLELVPSLTGIADALKHGKGWMRPRAASVSPWFFPARARVLPQPLGVVGVIAPWNYPLVLAVAPLTAALAAGNRAMVKLSEFTPTFSAVFAQRAGQTFASDEVAVVQGDAEIGAAFSALPFDHLLFTGSTGVGKRVMAAAAANLTPVTLELGGKSPAVITPGYDLAHAAQRILYGKLLNAGQTCIAPDYVLVPRAQQSDWVAACRAAAQKLYPDGLRSPDYTSIIDHRQYSRLLGLLGEARAAGAQVHALFDGVQADDLRHRLAPALVCDAPASVRLMNEEIFGPLLPVVAYDDLAQALAHLRSQPRPLALYWFDHDRLRTADALLHTHAGGVTVNDTLLHFAQDELPFGGVGASGMGSYHGRWGFDTFSKLKPVLFQTRFSGVGLAAPPYGPSTRWLMKFMGRL
ncbi:MAG: coniferyl aldehyde dehydrogenase [Betaproteobacteria bacterium]|nr:coniferyl aldehyde dehydrogenase [Betaproteobacteria bacterium]